MAIRKLMTALAAGGMALGLSLLAAPGTAFAAGGGYGGAPGAPGGTGAFSTVVVAQTIPAGGGTLTATFDGATLTMTIPAGDFSAPVQAVISAGDLTQLTNTGITGTPFLAFGAQVDQNGAKLGGPFPYPITLTVTDASITTSTVVYQQSGATYAQSTGWTESSGTASGGFTVDPYYVLANPAATGQPIPGATTAVTGKPFLGEGLAAFGLIGVAGLGAWRLRRSRVTV